MSSKSQNQTLQLFTPSLFPGVVDFSDSHLKEQLITYIGNKRSLLPFLNRGFEDIKKRVGKEKLVTFDGFAGSGSVSRLLKLHSSYLAVNDLEKYCEVINRCYLTNRSEVDTNYLVKKTQELNSERLRFGKISGFIERNYAPKDDGNIQEGERVFYTNRNAKIIDKLIRLIAEIPEDERYFFLAPLIVRASVHTNTSGVFKGFHKKNGIGHFGGAGENALSRIKGEVVLDVPVFSRAECEVKIFRSDINDLVEHWKGPEIDLAYFDPPYNQHPYGSNYFMLNLIAGDEAAFDIQDGVSGISKNWNRSAYNKTVPAIQAMERLIAYTPAKFILLSYNDEGIIPIDTMRELLSRHGRVELRDQDYNTYRGSRNLRDRSIKVKEYLWIIDKT